MSDPAAGTRARRTMLAVAAAVVGALLVAAASIGISVQLDKQARSEGECRSAARNVEFDGLRTEMTATTALITFAIQHPDRTRAELQDAVAAYEEALIDARRSYTAAQRQFAAC